MKLSTILPLAVLLLACSSHAYFQACHFWTDPNLITFTNYNTLYFCDACGWHLLLRNRFIEVWALVHPVNYVTIDYKVRFYNANGNTICSLQASTNQVTCSSPSGVSSTSFGSSYWTHVYNSGPYIYLFINRRITGCTPFYNIHIWQHPRLVSISSGICIRPTCTQIIRGIFTQEVSNTSLVPRSTTALSKLPIHQQICEVFSAVGRSVSEKPDENQVSNAVRACLNDLAVSNDAKFAQSAVSHIVLTSVQGDETVIPKSIPKLVEKIDKAIGEATVKVNEIIKNSKDICNENRVCLQPIE